MSFEWLPDVHGTGVPVIDDQHRELFEQLNRLVEACSQTRPTREVAEIVDFLESYVVRHFRTEEAIMERRDCPAAQANLREHERFLAELTILKTIFEREGATRQLAQDIESKLVDWLGRHIATIDVQLREPTR